MMEPSARDTSPYGTARPCIYGTYMGYIHIALSEAKGFERERAEFKRTRSNKRTNSNELIKPSAGKQH